MISTAALCSIGLTACSEPTSSADNPGTVTPPATMQPAISNNAARDSDAAIVRTIRDVSVRVSGPDGKAVANSVVVFSVLPEGSNDTTAMRLSSDDGQYANFASVKTDENGVASAHVMLSRHAGTTSVRAVWIPYQVSTTIQYTALAGAANKVVVTPADTILTPGQSITFSAHSFDQYNNLREDTIVFSTKSAGATVTSDGHAVVQSIGFHTIDATVISYAGGGKGSGGAAYLWVPTVRMAFTPLNGSGFPQAPAIGSPGASTAYATNVQYTPAWQPGQNRLAFVQNTNPSNKLMIREPDGSQHELVTGTGEPAWPEFSPDGQRVYFSAADAANISRVYRIRLDGSGLELVTANDTASAPTLSSDGTRLAFRSNKFIKMMDLRTGAVTQFASTNLNSRDVDAPRWSPDGQLIAFSGSGGLNVVRAADGSPVDAFSPNSIGWQPGFTWSQDSQILIAYQDGIPFPNRKTAVAIHIPTGRQYRLVGVGPLPSMAR